MWQCGGGGDRKCKSDIQGNCTPLFVFRGVLEEVLEEVLGEAAGMHECGG